MVECIRALSPAERAAQQASLETIFPELPGLSRAATILLYVTAFTEELDTYPWLSWTLRKGRRLLCPRVDGPSPRLSLHAVTDLQVDLVPGTRGIPEPRHGIPEVDPTEVDWVLVPGLAFDRRRYRLGRGAGLYDRLLPMLRPGTPRWALCFDCQWTDDLPIAPHDVPLDGIVSPERRAGLL